MEYPYQELIKQLKKQPHFKDVHYDYMFSDSVGQLEVYGDCQDFFRIAYVSAQKPITVAFYDESDWLMGREYTVDELELIVKLMRATEKERGKADD